MRELRLGCAMDAMVVRVVRVVYDLIQVDGPRDLILEHITRASVMWTMTHRNMAPLLARVEARALIPVPTDGKQTGTIIVSVTDAPFSVGNHEHIEAANRIEIMPRRSRSAAAIRGYLTKLARSTAPATAARTAQLAGQRRERVLLGRSRSLNSNPASITGSPDRRIQAPLPTI